MLILDNLQGTRSDGAVLATQLLAALVGAQLDTTVVAGRMVATSMVVVAAKLVAGLEADQLDTQQW